MLRACAIVVISLGVAACQPAAQAPAAMPAAPGAPSFAQAVCGDCHAVEAPFLSPNAQAPTFSDIANQQGVSAATLSAWLIDAHNYPEAMEFYLDAPRADELAAYIVSLRDPDYKPPIQ